MVPYTIQWDNAKSVFIVTGGIVCRKMPDVVNLVTTGLGVTVLAGVLSGVCYVFVQGIRNNRVRSNQSQWYCDLCGVHLNSTQNILNDDIVTCSQCGNRICRERCARPVRREKGWLCQRCVDPRRSWLSGIIQSINPNSTGFSSPLQVVMDATTSTETDADSLRKLEKEQVREFIEKLVNVMLGENVDNASVSMLYNDKRYLPVTGQSPCTAHAALKQVIERLLKEAVNLPLLEKAHAYPTREEEDNKNKNYEDLLATAIINKVISSCQNNLPSSSGNSVSSRLSTYSQNKDDKEYFFSEETLENKWKTTDLDSTSVSSLDDWIHSESSFGSRKYVDKVTLMIKQDIEEVDNLESEPEEDDVEYLRSASSLLTDSESNWLLQRRHFQGTPSPVPVPMLVPNPTTEAKVLIGDKPLDDTSDLSDVGSDFEEPEAPTSTHSLLVQSKNLIGGGNSQIHLLEHGDGHSESSTDSGVKEIDDSERKSPCALSNKADITVDDDNIEDSSYVSVYSNTEKEAEYTEKYESLPRHIVKHSMGDPSIYQIKNRIYTSESDRNDLSYYSSDEFCGNYSKKEKEKWNNAIEMENNPYSKENIEKRLTRSRSAASSLYNSKYLTKLSRMPSGGSATVAKITWPPAEHSGEESPPPAIPTAAPPSREAIQSSFDEIWHTQNGIIEASIILSDESSPPSIPSTAPPTQIVTSPDLEDINFTDYIKRAEPAIVIPESKMPHSTHDGNSHISIARNSAHLKKIHNFVNSTDLTTSDSDLSYVNSYDVEHSQVIKETKDKSFHIPIKTTHIEYGYNLIPDENDKYEINNNNLSVTEKIEQIESAVSASATAPVPVARPRNFIKNNLSKHDGGTSGTNSNKLRYISSTYISQPPMLTRHLSESSLLDDSFDTPPKVLYQKKDNTLISKIYKDPKVRLMAKSRDESTEVSEGHQHQTGMSYDSTLSHGRYRLNASKEKLYLSSEDGLSSEHESGRTGRMSFFDSEDDLRSVGTNGSIKEHVISTTNQNVSAKTQVENEKVFWRNVVSTPRLDHSRRFFSRSQDDLLTLDEVERIPKKKDNTLISKIYKDPRVLQFALSTHGDNIPDLEPATPAAPRTPFPITNNVSSSDDPFVFGQSYAVKRLTMPNKKIYKSYEDLSSADISLEGEVRYVYEADNELTSIIKDGYNSEDIDIDEIEKRHLVRNALGKLTQSEDNIRSAFERSTSQDDEVRVSVKDIRKKFECEDNHNYKIVSSLTARSLSKKVKETLRL